MHFVFVQFIFIPDQPVDFMAGMRWVRLLAGSFLKKGGGGLTVAILCAISLLLSLRGQRAVKFLIYLPPMKK